MFRPLFITLLRAAVAVSVILLLLWLVLLRDPLDTPFRSLWLDRPFGSLWWAPGLAVFFAGLAVHARAYWRYRDPADPSPRYAFEPPSDLPPGAVAMLTKNYSWVDARRAFQATVMDLARRGYGEFTSQGDWFEMRLDLDKPTGELHAFERKVLDYLKEAARQYPDGDDAHLEFGELASYTYAHSKAFLGDWGRELRAWVEARFGGLVTPESNAAARRWVLWITFGSAGFWTAFLISGLPLYLILVLLGFWLHLEVPTYLPAWREEAAREVYGWQAFRRTLRDYSRMNDAPDDFFVLWDRFYSYAVALGVAKRFIRNMDWAAPLSVHQEDAIDQENHPLRASENPTRPVEVDPYIIYKFAVDGALEWILTPVHFLVDRVGRAPGRRRRRGESEED